MPKREFKVGDLVAARDPDEKCFKYYGIVVVVAWNDQYKTQRIEVEWLIAPESWKSSFVWRGWASTALDYFKIIN